MKLLLGCQGHITMIRSDKYYAHNNNPFGIIPQELILCDSLLRSLGWQSLTMTMPLANFPRMAPMTSWYCVTDRTPSSPIHLFCSICRDQVPVRALLSPSKTL